jgi:hypothetical protein
MDPVFVDLLWNVESNRCWKEKVALATTIVAAKVTGESDFPFSGLLSWLVA